MNQSVLLAAVEDIIGKVVPPPGVNVYGEIQKGGLVNFLNNLLKLLIVVAGLYALINLIFAGYQFISAGGDPKNVEKAWSKIWQSLLGLFIVAASFALAGIIGWLIFGDPGAILAPRIYGPGE